MPETQQPRAVGVALPVREGVMLAMHRDPLPPTLPRGEPEQRPTTPIRDRMQSQCAMGESSVQVDRRRDDGDLGQRQRYQRRDPDGMQHRVNATSRSKSRRAAPGEDPASGRRPSARHVGPRVVLYPRHTHPMQRDTTLARSSHRPPPLAVGGPRPPLFLVDAHVQPTHARTTTAGQGSRSRLPGMHRRIA